MQTGNAGFAGAINYFGLMQGLRHGFASASTDDGHSGNGAQWALDQPQAVEDFAHRAVHLTRTAAKALVERYYGRTASRSYFSGCSEGGREALIEAQRYPDDFDGWLVGAPANNFTGLMLGLLNVTQIVAKSGEPLTQLQLAALHEATLRKCDLMDGVADDLVSEPLRCNLDPAELSCEAAGAPDKACLSRRQVDAVRRIHDDARHPITQASLAPGYRATRGSEGGEGEWYSFFFNPDGGSDTAQFFARNFWSYMVYDKANLDIASLDRLAPRATRSCDSARR